MGGNSKATLTIILASVFLIMVERVLEQALVEKKTLWLAVGGNVGIPLEVVTITARLTLIIWSRAQHLVITSYTRTHTNILTSTRTVDRQIRSVEVSDGPMSGFGFSSAWTKEK